ncbi:hypothetical protein [Natrinema altunense]|uniref:Uncharacterized protein n=1 Tax=Natrinema altunense TaxID=222984 RepID=A0A482Y1D5_9EURY|nr:hypothetical protein [Natrinema altunense]RZH67915.1 hypothetical protein ELS17_00075 [Natrinema altunense]
MEYKNNRNKSRRSILSSLSAAGIGLSAVGSVNAVQDQEATTKNAEEHKVYIRDLDIPIESDVNSIEKADIAILSTEETLGQGRFVRSLDKGTVIAFVGKHAKKTLYGSLQNENPSRVSGIIKSEVTDIGYSFGYSFEHNELNGVAMTYPMSENSLDIRTRSGSYTTDVDYYNAAVKEYKDALADHEQVTVMQTDSYGSEWESQGSSSSTTENCGGGTLKQVTHCYSLKDDNSTVSWHYSDRMTAGTSSEACDEYWSGYNNYALRRMSFGDHGGSIIDYGPKTTESVDYAEVSLSESGASVGYSYAIPDVTISATENHREDAIKWYHDVTQDSKTGKTTFVSEPAVVVDYSGSPDIVDYTKKINFGFKSGGSDWNIKDEYDGSWAIGD